MKDIIIPVEWPERTHYCRLTSPTGVIRYLHLSLRQRLKYRQLGWKVEKVG